MSKEAAAEENLVADHLGAVVRCPSVSFQDPSERQLEPFLTLHELLEELFPRTHRTLNRQVVGGASLLYHWPGRDPGIAPVLLMAHLDVVPVEPETERAWKYPPFGGIVADGYVWGRGALDTKSTLVGILEAVEALLARGFQPMRSVYLAFGHDEEVGGKDGARAIAEVLQARGVRLAWVLDEGGAVLDRGLVMRVPVPVALVGIAEKGYLTVEIAAHGPGGHAATPPRRTAVTELVRLLLRLEKRLFPTRIEEPVASLLKALAPALPWPVGKILSHPKAFSLLVQRVLLGNPNTAALVRTTQAITLLRAGNKENVVPQSAKATVNLRILPGETTDTVLARLRQVVGPRGRVEPLGRGWNPSPVTDPRGPAFHTVRKVVESVFPDSIVVPNLVSGATDSRYYQPLSEAVFRFAPLVLGTGDLPRVHGTDERVSVENLVRCVRFYEKLIAGACGTGGDPS